MPHRLLWRKQIYCKALPTFLHASSLCRFFWHARNRWIVSPWASLTCAATAPCTCASFHPLQSCWRKLTVFYQVTSFLVNTSFVPRNYCWIFQVLCSLPGSLSLSLARALSCIRCSFGWPKSLTRQCHQHLILLSFCFLISSPRAPWTQTEAKWCNLKPSKMKSKYNRSRLQISRCWTLLWCWFNPGDW